MIASNAASAKYVRIQKHYQILCVCDDLRVCKYYSSLCYIFYRKFSFSTSASQATYSATQVVAFQWFNCKQRDLKYIGQHK